MITNEEFQEHLPEDESTFHQLQRTSRDFLQGGSDLVSYLATLEELSDQKIPAEDFEQRIQAGLKCDHMLAELIAELSSTFKIWLLLDLPTAWVTEILERLPFVPPERIINLSVYKPHSDKDLFVRLIQDEVLRPSSTLLVDHDAHRSSTAIRVGLDVAIYVDADRLRRDFGLWRILPIN